MRPYQQRRLKTLPRPIIKESNNQTFGWVLVIGLAVGTIILYLTTAAKP